MALSTYNDLLTAIPAWAMRSGDTEFSAQVPDFIRLAEVRLNRNLRLAQMEKTATLTADANGVATLPADYLEYRAISSGVAGYPAIELVDPEGEIGRLPVGGVPGRVSFAGGSLQVYPAGASTVILTYYASVPALGPSNQTNWLLTAAPDVYLYASLLEAAPYMEEDSRAGVWKTYLEAAVADLKSTDVGARYARGQMRVRRATP